MSSPTDFTDATVSVTATRRKSARGKVVERHSIGMIYFVGMSFDSKCLREFQITELIVTVKAWPEILHRLRIEVLPPTVARDLHLYKIQVGKSDQRYRFNHC
jgi:hypothetical protein